MPKTGKKFNITKTFVDGIVPPAKGELFFRDEKLRGFGLRVSAGGSRSYFVEGRIYGKRTNRRIALGKHGKTTVELARREAKRLLAAMADGIDPVIASADSKVTAVTLDEVRNRYLSVRDLSKSGRKVYTSLLNRCLGDWLKKPLRSITKDMVELRHQELTRPTKQGTDGKCQANMAMTALNTLFNFAMDEYETADGEPVISRNPVRRLSQNRRWHIIRRRQVVVPDEMLPQWFAAVQAIRQEKIRDYVVFVLLTGMRKMEAARLCWDDVDFANGVITVRAAHTKNRLEYCLPVGPYLTNLLRRRKAKAGGSPWVFPGRGEGHIVDSGYVIEGAIARSGFTWTMHCLRATFITAARKLGIPDYQIKLLVNHRRKADVTEGYIVLSADDVRPAMLQIEAHFVGKFAAETVHKKSMRTQRTDVELPARKSSAG